MFLLIAKYCLVAYLGWQFYVNIIRLLIDWFYYHRIGLKTDLLIPFVGFPGWILLRDIPKHGDPLYTAKQALKANPDKKFYVCNYSNKMFLCITDPHVAREFYSEKRKHYSKDTVLVNHQRYIIKKGMIFIEGNLWKKHRRIISELFHFDFLKTMIPIVNGICKENWNTNDRGDLNKVDVLSLFQFVTGSAVSKLFIGFELSAEKDRCITERMTNIAKLMFLQRLHPLYLLFGTNVIKLNITDAHREINDGVKFLNDYGRNILEIKREQMKLEKENSSTGGQKKAKGLFDLILERNAEAGSENEDFFTDEEILDEFLTFFVAGTDTTGHLLAFAAYHLVKFPEWQAKIRQEIDALIPETSIDEITMDALNNLVFMNAFIKECLRLYPPASLIFDVKAEEPHTLGGVDIKPGTLVTVLIAALQTHPKYYKDPDAFRPDRWLNEEEVKEIDQFADIAFSAGQRNCIGQHFAKMETKLIIASFLRRYDLEFTDPKYELKTTMEFILAPRETLFLKLTPRRK